MDFVNGDPTIDVTAVFLWRIDRRACVGERY